MNNRKPPFPRTASEDDEFILLAYRYLDDLLSKEEFERFTVLLESDENLRNQFVSVCVQNEMINELRADHRNAPNELEPHADEEAIMNLTALLQMEQNAEAEIVRAPARSSVTKNADSQHPLVQRYMQQQQQSRERTTKHYIIPKPIFYGTISAIAAVALFAILAIWPQESPLQPPEKYVTTKAPVVASVIKSYNARFADSEIDVQPGDELHAERMRLQQGVVEIEFQAGAVMVVEGPCEFTLSSGQSAQLHEGQVYGRVPSKAVGFAVRTPTANIVDLGTEFGVACDQTGKTDVHVFIGEVDAALLDADGNKIDSIRLTEDIAAVLKPNATRIETRDIDRNQFVRNIDEVNGPWIAARSNPVPRGHIQIDGEFDDWKGIRAFPTDPVGDATVSDKSIDYVQCWIAHDENKIFVRYELANPTGVHEASNWTLFDTDLNAETGLGRTVTTGIDADFFGVGAEFNIQGHTAINSWGRDGRLALSTPWDQTGARFAVSSDGKHVEIMIHRTSIGNPDVMHVGWIGENRIQTIDGNSGVTEYYPDALRTDKEKSFFRYVLE